MSLFNVLIDIEDENNDPYYHENRNIDNMNLNGNYENTYEDNNTGIYNLYDNNNFDITDNNIMTTLRNLLSYITNNTFMFNNNTNMSVDNYIENQDNEITVEISEDP